MHKLKIEADTLLALLTFTSKYLIHYWHRKNQ